MPAVMSKNQPPSPSVNSWIRHCSSMKSMYHHNKNNCQQAQVFLNVDHCISICTSYVMIKLRVVICSDVAVKFQLDKKFVHILFRNNLKTFQACLKLKDYILEMQVSFIYSFHCTSAFCLVLIYKVTLMRL